LVRPRAKLQIRPTRSRTSRRASPTARIEPDGTRGESKPIRPARQPQPPDGWLSAPRRVPHAGPAAWLSWGRRPRGPPTPATLARWGSRPRLPLASRGRLAHRGGWGRRRRQPAEPPADRQRSHAGIPTGRDHVEVCVPAFGIVSVCTASEGRHPIWIDREPCRRRFFLENSHELPPRCQPPRVDSHEPHQERERWDSPRAGFAPLARAFRNGPVGIASSGWVFRVQCLLAPHS